ncbi:hypothetical protein [Glaciibacter psychrotolerans]|uniref:Uncharacterized protein n=1 Tax=Glaciibacter psychrotolerans TaxID=670054 RepID=A0A7Z0ECM6_9MICO|nr:hypothetical protein [Leifsonia psychrotolerans]NYJ19140.1 hypothetical protein [Leifsonia psychrotolerans]
MTSADAGDIFYIAEFTDGPLEGQTDRRVLVHGRPEPRVSMVAAIDSMESLFWYDSSDQRDVQGQLHVRYVFDSGDSDPVESNTDPD